VPRPPHHPPLRPDPHLAALVERLGLEFSVEFHETARRHHPDDLEVLAELGHAYTRLGRHQHGLEVDRRLVALAPDNPTVHYNLACSLALLGQAEEAVGALEEAVRLGYEDLAHLLQDADLASLRELPRFRSVVTTLEQAGRRG